MARRGRQLGRPFWAGTTAVFLCLTLGTFTILGKNFANNFYVAGSRQFESVGPATVANIAAQLVLAALLDTTASSKITGWGRRQGSLSDRVLYGALPRPCRS